MGRLPPFTALWRLRLRGAQRRVGPIGNSGILLRAELDETDTVFSEPDFLAVLKVHRAVQANTRPFEISDFAIGYNTHCRSARRVVESHELPGGREMPPELDTVGRSSLRAVWLKGGAERENRT